MPLPKTPIYLGTDHSGQVVISWTDPEPPEDSAATRWHLLAEVEREDLVGALTQYKERLKAGEL